MKNGLDLPYFKQGKNVPMFITSIDTEKSGKFSGKMVVTQRWIPREKLVRSIQITSRFPNQHGTPIQVGNSSEIGIEDPYKPDFGDPWIPPIMYISPIDNLTANFSQLIWPALVVSARYIAVTLRMARATILDVLSEDYIQTARSKGTTERTIVRRHALRNAFLPILTLLGAEFAFLIGGLVITKQIFNLNGVGTLLIQAVEYSDYTVVQTLVMIIALIFIFVNFLIDIVYTLLDPRIRYN